MRREPSVGQRRATRIRAGAIGFGLGVTLIFAAASGCSSRGSGVPNATLPEGVRSQAIEHEACEETGHKVETVDVNNDGKPDIRRVYAGGREVCRISDLNGDGKPDMFEYYDASGQLRRRESDYDDNGIVNAIELFEDGKRVRSEVDTTSQGKIDTWDTFDPATGKRVKRERDTTGDGRIDQWWTYSGDQVTIAMDKDGDGLPDPGSVITLGASGQSVPTPEPDASAPPEVASTPRPSPMEDAGVDASPEHGGGK